MSKFTEEEIKAAVEQANKSEDKYASPSNQPLLYNAVKQMFSHHSVEVNKEEHIFSQDFTDDMFIIHAVYRVGGEWGPTLLREVSYHKRETVTCPISGEEFFSEDGIEYNGLLCSPNAVAVCAYSGEVHLKSEMTETQDGLVFDDYLEDHYSKCEECGEWVRNSYLYTVSKHGEDVDVCEDCRNDHYTRCEDCGVWVLNDEIHLLSGDHYVCNICIDEYEYCERCGEYVPSYDYNYDASMCCSCHRELRGDRIRDYHGHHSYRFPYFIYDKKLQKTIHTQYPENFKGIGIELEAEGDDDLDTVEEIINVDGIWYEDDCGNNEVYFETDGSLDEGFELITRPHDRESFFRMPWEKILEVYKRHGYHSHDGGNCGLHVHISRSVFGRTQQEQDRAIAKLYRLFNERWSDLSKFSRRDSIETTDRGRDGFYYCERAYVPAIKDVKRIMSDVNAMSRYHAINNKNNHTVEVRLGRGTLKLESFLSWIDLVATLAWNARKISFNNITDMNLWLKGIKPETAKALKEKGIFMDAEIVKEAA